MPLSARQLIRSRTKAKRKTSTKSATSKIKSPNAKKKDDIAPKTTITAKKSPSKTKQIIDELSDLSDDDDLLITKNTTKKQPKKYLKSSSSSASSPSASASDSKSESALSLSASSSAASSSSKSSSSSSSVSSTASSNDSKSNASDDSKSNHISISEDSKSKSSKEDLVPVKAPFSSKQNSGDIDNLQQEEKNEESDEDDEEKSFDAENYFGNLPSDHIPTLFVPQQRKAYKKVKAFPSTKKAQITVLSHLAYLRSTVYNKKVASSQAKSHQKGYRFPLKSLLTLHDRPELKHLGNKFYKDSEKRMSNAWLYYFPSTSDLDYPVCHEFFNHIFPSRGEHFYVSSVHNHHNTEAFAIAIEDNIFRNVKVAREPTSNILSMISFRILPKREHSGAFIYYLGTFKRSLIMRSCPRVQLSILCSVLLRVKEWQSFFCV